MMTCTRCSLQINFTPCIKFSANTGSEGAQALRWAMESVDYQGMFGITPPIPILADIKIGGDERPDLGGLKPEWWNDDEEQAAAHYLAHVHQVA